jgi:uncharacterized membrane protein YcfT
MTQGDPQVKEHSVKEMKQKIKWINTISIIAIHLLALHSVVTIAPLVRWQTFLWGEYLLHVVSNILSPTHIMKDREKMEAKY